MEDDPLPAPAFLYNNHKASWIHFELTKTKLILAIILCLLIGMGLVLYPNVVFEQSESGLWILKLNSSVNQAPRAVIFGALAVLPEKIELEGIPLPQMGEFFKGTIEYHVHTFRSWLVMVWYGSTYV